MQSGAVRDRSDVAIRVSDPERSWAKESQGGLGDELGALLVEEVAGVCDQPDAQVVGVWLIAAERGGDEREVLRCVEHEGWAPVEPRPSP
jgi:hypothetical protein